MRRLRNIILSLYAWIGITLVVLTMLPVLALVRLFDRDPARYRTGYVFRRMGSWLTKVNPMWKVDLKGAEKIDNPRNPYVVVSNHQVVGSSPSSEVNKIKYLEHYSKSAVFSALP